MPTLDIRDLAVNYAVKGICAVARDKRILTTATEAGGVDVLIESIEPVLNSKLNYTL